MPVGRSVIVVGAPLAGRLDPGWFAGLLRVVGRPGRVADALLLVPRYPLHQRVDPSRRLVDADGQITRLGIALGGEAVEGEVLDVHVVELVPPKRRRHVTGRANAIRRRHGLVTGVLVVVDEHAVPLFLPPGSG